MPGVPGCIEQSTKLAAALHEAHVKHRSIAVCWLDLANAYGSVHHDLIHFTLQHYNAPSRLSSIVANLYCGLQALVTSPDWTSKPIPLNTGVYQGDPFSVVIFNTVMCTMADSLKSMEHLGYKFSGSPRSIHLLQYADDTCLISDGPASCKTLLEGIERWLNWSGLKAKVPKCHSIALQASTAKVYDPQLHLYGRPIHFIGNEAIKFLGMKVQVPRDSQSSRVTLATKLSTMMERVDTVPITSHQKLLLYRAAICPRLNWDFTINQLPLSWVSSILEATATRFLKKWVGLAKPTDPPRLYLPKKKGSPQESKSSCHRV